MSWGFVLGLLFPFYPLSTIYMILSSCMASCTNYIVTTAQFGSKSQICYLEASVNFTQKFYRFSFMHKIPISCPLPTSVPQTHQSLLCDPQKREGLEITNKQTLKGYLKGIVWKVVKYIFESNEVTTIFSFQNTDENI